MALPGSHFCMNLFKAVNQQHECCHINMTKDPVLIEMGLKCLRVDRFYLNCKNSELALRKWAVSKHGVVIILNFQMEKLSITGVRWRWNETLPPPGVPSRILGSHIKVCRWGPTPAKASVTTSSGPGETTHLCCVHQHSGSFSWLPCCNWPQVSSVYLRAGA